MSTIRTAVLATFMAAMTLPAAAQSGPSYDPEQARQYIEKAEHEWADAVVTGNTDDIKRIFADDCIGVDSEGRQYDKATFLAEIVEAPKYFVSNKINTVKIRLYGTTAISQGDETFEQRGADHKRGRFVFTDTWLLRDGKWQVIATEAVMAPEVPK